jgi:hypothetical protein
MNNKEWVDVHDSLPRRVEDVEIMREDGTTDIGYYYNSPSSGVTWIDGNKKRVIHNKVIAWRYE